MNPTGKLVSLAYALVLLACALAAGFDTWAFAFAIGDGGGQVGLAAGTLLIGTLIGGVGLVVAALASWTRWRSYSMIAFVSALIVLPAAAIYGWAGTRANWLNTQHGMHFPLWNWALCILPPFLGLLAVTLSWVRFRQLGQT